MNNCKSDELKKLGWDGVYDLIQEQQEQIDRIRTVLTMMINNNYYMESRILLSNILFGEGDNDNGNTKED